MKGTINNLNILTMYTTGCRWLKEKLFEAQSGTEKYGSRMCVEYSMDNLKEVNL